MLQASHSRHLSPRKFKSSPYTAAERHHTTQHHLPFLLPPLYTTTPINSVYPTTQSSSYRHTCPLHYNAPTMPITRKLHIWNGTAHSISPTLYPLRPTTVSTHHHNTFLTHDILPHIQPSPLHTIHNTTCRSPSHSQKLSTSVFSNKVVMNRSATQISAASESTV